MFEVMAIDHIVLRTGKLKEMLYFYTDVLGCKIEREISSEFGLTQVRAGNALIDLVDVESELGRKGGGAPTATENNLDHFCLQLKSMSNEDILRHLESFDIEVGEFSNRYGAQGYGQSIYINDPEGNVVELRSQI
jgi:catechol-2,3-dioxygenase